MAYARPDTYKITRRLYRLIRTHPNKINFEHLRGLYGTYDYETEEIKIDHRKSIISTLIHEALHKWNPDWSESKVLSHEKQIMNALTVRQIKKILKVMANNL